MEFSDFPMPDHLPDFARNDQIAAYFDTYVDYFRFRNRINFNTGVKRVAPLPNGGFLVTLDEGDRHRYDAVCVANGHHWDPLRPEPEFPGSRTTSIEQIHSYDYTSEQQLAGKQLVVLAIGNSAMDIAVDSSYHADATYLPGRSGVHVIPKYVFGRPSDQIAAAEWIPASIRWPLARVIMKAATGPMSRYGLPAPKHKFAQAYPMMSIRILDRLAHGAILPKPNIESFGSKEVLFSDGSRVEADLVVYCTGFKLSFPFFDSEFLSPSDHNEIRLYARVFSPTKPNLYFVGLIRSLGAIMPIAEHQSELIADHLQGRYLLPGREEIEAEIDTYRQKLVKRYVPSKRHTIQVDFDDYMRFLRAERERGAKRSRRLPPHTRLLGPTLAGSSR